ncbi:MAG: hypothetical protein R3175_09650 [Marinobacter sp.]|uniref:hypothetical protein n=1 Tax=Marinobacter sp. TaxID=50741 RepID=UPI00299EB7A9|nr:hypothetical protein [Marinobacter sp.]MDX1756310.1 hypothetical protein [Marinobacter sp.]
MTRLGNGTVGLLYLALGLCQPALAWELMEERLFFNSYGTLGIATLDDSEVAITNNHEQSIDDNPSAGYDSRIGLQLEYRLANSWSLAWQGLGFKDGDNSYTLTTKWAYLSYDATPWLNLRLGRFITPFYMISEQRYVGYSQPWARPPLEVYGDENEFDTSEGLWASLVLPTTNINSTLEVFVSRLDQARSDFDVELSPIVGAVLSLSRHNVSLRLMAARLPIELESAELEGLETLLQQPNAEHDYDLDAMFRYYNVGLQYSDLNWLGMMEYVQNRADSHFYPEIEAFTVTAGRHVESVLLYVLYAKRAALNNDSESGLTGAANVAANGIIDRRKARDQSTLGVGVRWDVTPGVALKGQWDHVRVKPGDRGGFDRAPDGHVNVFTLSGDWAF